MKSILPMKRVNRDMLSSFRKRFFTLRSSLVISMALHLIILFSPSFDNTQSKQIILESKKADITFINYSEKTARWDMVEPVRERAPFDGDFPLLFKKKKRVEREPHFEPMMESLSSEAVKVRESYESEVLKRIHRMKYYPQYARRMGMEGDVTIRFTLDSMGRLINHPVIERGSSHDVLNRAGVSTIARAVPFAQFPEDLAQAKENMTFVVTIDYSLRIN